MRFSTKAIHVGQEPDELTGSVAPPIYQTSTFSLETPERDRGYVYSRSGNPTRDRLEKNLASLENGRFGLAFSSGMAAIEAVMHLLKRGDHVIACDDLYGGTYRLFEKVFGELGINFSYIDFSALQNLENLITKDTRMVWIETPTNPLLKIIDIRAVADVCKERGLLLVVDNTFATPYNQRPLELGADIVVHSLTKYLGGHSDLIAGAILVNDGEICEKLRFIQKAVGAVPSPFDCWLVLRSVKTLAVRMERHNSNAMKIAEFLKEHEKVKRVYYPGLKEHPQHDVAEKQMITPYGKPGFGGMISFELNADQEATKKFISSTKLIKLGVSLGGVESLIEHPASMSHASIPKERRIKFGITDNLVRLSVGIEDEEDIIQDLENAFDSIK